MIKAELNRAAYLVAEQADAIETDAAHAETEDDLLALLSQVEILERNAATLRETIKRHIEG